MSDLSAATVSSADRFGPVRYDRWTQALLVITVTAAILRFWRLGAWSFAGDEAFTLYSSTSDFSWADPRPLAFAINHFVLIPLLGISEFTLRLAPALTGIAAVPMFGWAVGRLYGRRAGVFTALTMAVSPLLLFHSQWARYYMQSYLLAGFVPFAVRFWIEGAGRRWLWIAAACCVAGWFFVPSSSFILGGLALWGAANFRALKGRELVSWLSRPRVVTGVALAGAAILGVMLAKGVLDSSRRDLESIGRSSLPHIVFATGLGLTVPVSLAALGGFFLLSRDRDLSRPDRTFLPLLMVGSTMCYALAYPFVFIDSVHVVSVLAVVHAAAGVAFDRIWRAARATAIAAVSVAIILLSTAPELVSYYVDGDRVDYRTASEVLRAMHRQRPGPVLANSHAIVRYYAPELWPREFISSQRPAAWLDDSARTSPVWVLLVEHRNGVNGEGSVPAVQVVMDRCHLRARIARERFDYHVDAIRIYECAPARENYAASRTVGAASPSP
ncbi:MAG: hypothetical protein ABSG61_04580 [Gemmatimonadales bacterium]